VAFIDAALKPDEAASVEDNKRMLQSLGFPVSRCARSLPAGSWQEGRKGLD